MGSLYVIWAASCATASSRSCGSDRQIPKGVEIPLRRAPSLITTRTFPPLFAPPLSNCLLYHHHGETKSMAEELLARAGSNSYKRGAHQEEDSKQDNRKYNDKTKMNQNAVLDRYVL